MIILTNRVRVLELVRDGLTLHIHDGVSRSISLPLRARPVVDDIEARVRFWSRAQPTWSPEQLAIHALWERGCAVAAQNRRRFGRVFRHGRPPQG